MNTLVSIAMLALSALPPHHLNQSIGGRDGNQKPRRVETVRENILNSRAFELMVTLAVTSAQDPRMSDDFEMKNLNFGQRARIILARLFEDTNYVKEWMPSKKRGFGASDGPLPRHPLDTVIGEQPRSEAAVVKSLRESRAFADIVYQAARECEPLRRGLAGLNYAESVRVAIARLMQQVTDSPDNGGKDEPVSNQAAQDEFKKLQGTWDFAFMQHDGKPKDIAGRQYIFDGGQLIVRQDDKTLDKVAFRLNPSTQPKSIFIDFDVRVNDRKVGAHGIYALDGNTLTFCTVAAVLPLPTAFESKPGSHQWLVVMKRSR